MPGIVYHEAIEQTQNTAVMAMMRGAFTEADSLLGQALKECSKSYDDEPTGEVHAGRIVRDQGLLAGRRAIFAFGAQQKNQEETAGELWRAIVLANASDDLLNRAQMLHFGTPEARSDLQSERAATYTAIARLAVPRVLLGKDEMEDAREFFQKAERTLAKGGNGYYRASNLLLWARAERLDKHPARSTLLANKAIGVGLAALAHGEGPQALATTIARLPDLRSKHAAQRSVFRTKPGALHRGQIVNI